MEADYLAEGGFYNNAVNRLYYACYYAASALLLKHRLDCKTHVGVKNQLSLHFIKTGLLDAVHGATFWHLFNARQSGDYEDFVYNDLVDYQNLKPRALEFIEAVTALL